MKEISTAVWAEYMKIRMSKILFVTIGLFIFIPVMIGLMMFVSMNPDLVSKLGLMGTKSKMFGENDWSGYLSLINQMIAAFGLIGFGFVTSWVFAREHIDRTMKDIIALPVSRTAIVFGKFVLTFIWCMLLSLIFYLVCSLMGKVVGIFGWSGSLFLNFSRSYFLTVLLTSLLCSPVAFIAGYSRGIIAPLGFVILTMILAQFTGLLGLGPYFPWAIPGLFSVAQDSEGLRLFTSSYFILAITSILGFWGTVQWWKTADHHS